MSVLTIATSDTKSGKHNSQHSRTERKQAATAGAHEDDKAGLAMDESAQDVPAPEQAPPPPLPAPQPWTIHSIAPLSVAHGYPTRGMSDPGQAMPALLQPLMQMISLILDLSPLFS
ncbi:hypothetical protein Tco_1431490 [Tanacetum coccineum]